MNTVRSTWFGWGALCVAGGGAYYFAKKSINADRASRHEAELRRKASLAAAEYQERRSAPTPSSLSSAPPNKTPVPTDDPSLQRAKLAQQNNVSDVAGSPSSEASNDPAPTRHEPDTDAQRVLEKSKYEATETFRPPRGNRLS
ncbi:hypothetical protein DTO271D3_9035 [Paecilomyces variotii]|nr:hypothetical protein DTO032I3_1712 [Paecilomyces variotii]KAJ9266012.1 hypothetical protein DTO212C5_6451 [Paecilomyces variotii]KAJ9278136.1 hypothetical protein DTO021D3_4870 [Paecilomyces variotii]KAJ9310718.1 hypothetical protein DTO271D3_9035 [Paecilomyces variotii]KAJ9345500.1 hypothetical protein DTO027B6_2031 [Paecilomyces variotii]